MVYPGSCALPWCSPPPGLRVTVLHSVPCSTAMAALLMSLNETWSLWKWRCLSLCWWLLCICFLCAQHRGFGVHSPASEAALTES